MARQKVVLVTGASSGIGLAAAVEFAKRGYKVYACARRLAPMAPLEAHGIHTLVCDVTQTDAVARMCSHISSDNDGRLDILYNNAGQACTMAAMDATDAAVAQCFAVNVFAPMAVTREFAALLIKARGTVGFTGSVSGVLPAPFLAVYSASKAALHQYVATLRVEMEPFGVTVLNFVTGSVQTPIGDLRGLPEHSRFRVPGIDAAMAELLGMTALKRPVSAELYARRVVGDFEAQRLGGRLHIYRGGAAYFAGHLLAWCPRVLAEKLLVSQLKFSEAFEYIRARHLGAAA
ncbi:NAD(P)-binding protein [Metschnikowia bicuspidata var. bicuspidata NRRL YB-4993]|uniref:NAD(P)-binding protein n=1 Tax=Metschnikowia bicuspidata var. bicuspidata NRRL YB-4993 TaxID=869754 RepID=A0A1A0HF01_9ASCO|nr:NAD(P)-binding protein [Metschnikowia bicuspidata var. bicuspidata NRRL YB-4993]OBA22704.1 NAD(P)-binding protein [Metschnikowia bicuspidata var. bicuspidata NRRL YB-4993]